MLITNDQRLSRRIVPGIGKDIQPLAMRSAAKYSLPQQWGNVTPRNTAACRLLPNSGRFEGLALRGRCGKDHR